MALKTLTRNYNTKDTPQTQAIPGKNQVKNSAGGYSFEVNDWQKLNRFLVIGTENGSYYANANKMTKNSCEAAERCIKEDGLRVVNEVVRVSKEGLAPKNDQAIFVLAMAAHFGDEKTKKAAYDAYGQVCRIGTHIMQFSEALEAFRNSVGSAGYRRANDNWFNGKSAEDLSYQAIKYQQRDGWSLRDILRLSHVKPVDEQHGEIYKWITKGWDSVPNKPSGNGLDKIWAFERAKKANDKKEIVGLIVNYGLPREAIPTQFLNDVEVWEALLEDMPVTAMVRNLGKMSSVGLLKPLSAGTKKVISVLENEERIKKARIHPMSILVAMNIYNQGKGDKGSLSWSRVPEIVGALDGAFYLAFKAVEPTNLNWMLCLDVSGSMAWGDIAGMPGITPAIGSTAMALVTANVEKNTHIMAFADSLKEINITKKDSLRDACSKTSRINFGGTDCSLPMLYAMKNKLEVDVFTVYTDSKTYAGRPHPSQAIEQYRQKMGRDAKLIVCGMVANNSTIADPNDPGMLDVVGFSTDTPAAMAAFAKE